MTRRLLIAGALLVVGAMLLLPLGALGWFALDRGLGHYAGALTRGETWDAIRLTLPGELIALLGASGSGKTTLLRIIAGLEQADAGRLSIGGRPAETLSPAERRVGFVFQHYALFRHMTVAQNVGFGLSVKPRRERPSRAAIAGRVEALLALVRLEGYERRYPAQLSGGQRQRVALARALAVEPRLDEPFGALDAEVRLELRQEVRRLHDRLGLTSIIVTHDRAEAESLADRIETVAGGRLVAAPNPNGPNPRRTLNARYA